MAFWIESRGELGWIGFILSKVNKNNYSLFFCSLDHAEFGVNNSIQLPAMKSKFLLSIILLFSLNFVSKGQETTSDELRRNTIKYDLTSHLLYQNTWSFSYERVVKKNQSFGLTLGYLEFPKITNFGDGITAEKKDSKSGFKYGAEYRFYLAKENKYSAPRGVYIGPYFSNLGFKSDRQIEYEDGNNIESALLNSKLNILNIGGQLGYQFVFNDRWVLDLVLIGPSISRYNFKLDLEGDFNFDPDEVQQEILDALIQKFPLLEEVIDEKKLESSGILDTWALGYRYQFLVGYRFGKYKKLKK